MSGVIKAVGKVFSAVVNVVKKVALPLLAVAAVVFTGGAALGATGLLAGGWAGAASGIVSSLGLGEGLLGSVMTGALTNAGYGAVIGGIGSAVTGGNIMKGMETGALGGAVTGGVGGLLSGPATAATAASAPTTAPGTMSAATGASAPASAAGGVAVNGAASNGIAAAMASPAASAASASLAANAAGAVAPAATSSSGGLFSSLGNFAQSEGGGKLIAGIGQGLLSGQDKADEAKALMARDQAGYKWVTGNYANAGGPTTAGQLPSDANNPTPSQRFDSGGRYVYDSTMKKLVFVPYGNQAASSPTP